MQKLRPSFFVWAGLVFLAVSVIAGWIIGPFVIDKQVSQVSMFIFNDINLWWQGLDKKRMHITL
jgi:hypothetical protein